MLHLISLVCPGCEAFGKPDSFYDSENIRPFSLPCRHSLCTKCVEIYLSCPICNKKVEKTENYAASNIYDECKKTPMTIFEKWWIDKGIGMETCSGCYESTRNIRFCISCELDNLLYIIIYGVPDDTKSWEKKEEKQERRKMIEKLSKEVVYEESDPSVSRDELDLRIAFNCDFYKFANSVLCSDCILDKHKGHLISTLEELEPIIDGFKQSAAIIAKRFLWKELKEIKGKCKIKTMRMHRTCEKLVHYACFYYRSADTTLQPPDAHFRSFSQINKFFESLPWNNIDEIPREQVDKLILSLKTQLEYLKSENDCNCGIIWEEMQKLRFGNQVDKKFVEVIDELELNIVSEECLFQSNQLQEICDKARELSEGKLYLIYTAFCWNHENGVPHLFDKLCCKPCICPVCKVSTCMECVRRDPSNKCLFCGTSFYNFQVDNVQNVNNDVLDLVSFYNNNCVEVFEEWWNCDASRIGFCLNCSSYTEHLEVCAICELYEVRPVLTTKPKIEGRDQFNQTMPLFFKYDGLKRFPTRWQCAYCKNRLNENWVHKNSGNPDSEKWAGKWNRGCNHLKSRIAYRKCSPDDELDKCEYNANALKDIGFYEAAMKVATMELVHRILKSGIEEKVKCELRKIRMLRRQGLLKSKTRYYFKNSMTEKITEELKNVALEITNLIEVLKTEWRNYQSEKALEKECSCTKIWNDGNNELKYKLKNISKFRLNEGIDKCPFELNHGIDLEEVSENEDSDDTLLNLHDLFI